MLPTWREKLLGQEFDNLGQLAQQVAALNNQFQNMRRDTRLQKIPQLPKPITHIQLMTAMRTMKKKILLRPNGIGTRRQ